MRELIKERIIDIRKKALKEKETRDFNDALKSIENDEEFIKLYNMTVQKYLDSNKDPNDITFSEIIDLDLDYFARSYGVKCFILKNDSGHIDFYDI